jgi:hypothetical protein
MTQRVLHISEDLSLPLATVTSTVIVYGGKGMGKTNFGSVLVEELSAAKQRWCALDPMGVWWGLRHARDGKGRGVECLIMGGAHGDIPIEPTGGGVAADLVVDEDANVIIDFSRKPNGETWGVGEKIRFITDYGRRLFQRQGSLVNGKRREPIFQVLDEAARFIPQMIRAGQPELAQCLSVWAQMVEEGRNFGLGVCLLTQRSARLNKDVAELADAMIAFRTVGPNSIDAVMDWLGEHVPKEKIKTLIEKLRSLPVGHCLVVSPGWLGHEAIVKIRERTTFDSSDTPKPGESTRRVTGEGAKPDLAKYAARMQETIERVKANDPAELKKKLADLQKQLAAKPAAAGKTVTKVADQRAIAQALKKRDQEWQAYVRDYKKEIMNAAQVLTANLHTFTITVPPSPEIPVSLPVISGAERSPVPIRRVAPAVHKRTENPGDESNGLTKPQNRILAALAEFEALGKTSIDKRWIAALSQVSATSSAFTNNLGALRSGGYIEYPASGFAQMTDKGRDAAPTVEAPQSPEEMISRCKSIVTRPQAEILDCLYQIYPKAIEKATVAELVAVSPTSSAFTNNLGSLRSAGMIDYPQTGMARLQDWVMLQEKAA